MTATELPWRIIVSWTGDVAEAEDIDSALLAAYTLIDDAGARNPRGTVRRSVYITKDGRYNSHATELARRGYRSINDFERQELEALAARNKRAGR